ncbi:MAG: DUF6288 domain-containing protein [Planctomycetota bacterium]|jgi:hypothetical protein|nr:DUF6288 domain-containing protein [Planctomycetota bacterium]
MRTLSTHLLRLCLLAACLSLAETASAEQAEYEIEDLAETKAATPGQVYRMGETGICGTVEADHILVTQVIPGSTADGKIRKGDRIRGMQHRGMGGWGGIPNLVRIRLYRIGRDWDWHFYVTVERASLRGGKGNTVTFDLRMPPAPGNVCHYGPTGFFAKRHPDHLVVDVVEKGSPSEGKLKKDDIILAVDGQPITVDAYHLFARAIDKAESEQGGGKLKLTVRRSSALQPGSDSDAKDGTKVQTPDTRPQTPVPVTLNLKVLGSYSETAPVDCSKTDVLITQAADFVVKSKRFGTLQAGLLGLLATGEEQYVKIVRDTLHAAAWAQPPKDLNELVGTTAGYVAWRWGYQTLLMAEYYLLTGDKFVLPAITKYARGLASGQDQAGLWGHQMCHKELGRAYGYGVMNQPTITVFIALILAEKCGVKEPMVRAAIERTHAHYDKWVGRGALPYGNHAPMEHLFTNNGTSGSLAVALGLLGNEKGARFYATMSAAATDEILTGHSGPWWNILWSGLGANILGPEVAAAYNRKIHWLRTVARTWNGRHVGLMGWGSNPKPGRLSDTGSHLLNLCTGRRAIHITGKGMDKSLWVTAKQASEIIESGTMDDSSKKALLVLLGSPLPPVRLRAAQQLARQDADVTNEVMDLLATGTSHQRVGAIHAIQNLKIPGAADEFLAIAKDEMDDIWVRQLAVKALGGMEEAKLYAPELLRLLVKDKTYDPYRELDIALGSALVKLYEPDPYATDLDKDVFYRGVTKLLNHKHASGRGAGMSLIKNLPREDLLRMLDKMVYLIEDKDRTYTSYTGAGRQDALEILYRHGIRESMDYTVNTIKEPTGRGGPRTRARTRLLQTFGAEAKYLIPRIKEVLGNRADEIIKAIEASETPRKMINLEEVKKREK